MVSPQETEGDAQTESVIKIQEDENTVSDNNNAYLNTQENSSKINFDTEQGDSCMIQQDEESLSFLEEKIKMDIKSNPKNPLMQVERTWSNPGIDPPKSPVSQGKLLSRVKSTGAERDINILPVIVEETDAESESNKTVSSYEEATFLRRNRFFPSSPVRSKGSFRSSGSHRTSGMSVDSFASCTSESVYYSMEDLSMLGPPSVEGGTVSEKKIKTTGRCSVMMDTIRDILLILKLNTCELFFINRHYFNSIVFCACVVSSCISKMVSSFFGSNLINTVLTVF